MGCRTRVIGNHYNPDKEVTCGRGNLSFTSINLPRLGIIAKGDIAEFYKLLDKRLEMCCRQLLHRFDIQKKKTVRNYPFLMGQGIWIDSDMLDIDEEVGEVLKNGTLSLGFIGLAEALVVLTGKHHGESEESRRLGLEIITHMREYLDDESDKRGLNFTLLATPAEGLSGRFVRIDQERFGKIADTEQIIMQIKSNPLLYGVTFSCGEPFCQAKALLPVAEAVKAMHKQLMILGFSYFCIFTDSTFRSLIV